MSKTVARRSDRSSAIKYQLFTIQDVHRAGGMVMRLAARAVWIWKRRHGDFSLRVVEALVRPGNVVIDVGASWGLYTARMARLVGRAGRVHAFEPHPANLGNLRALARGNENLALYQLALSDRTGEACLHVPLYGKRRITALGSLAAPRGLSPTAYEQVTVRTNCLDAVLTTRPEAIDFIKVDVEGHELAVLRGAERLLRRDQPALLIELEQRHPTADITATVAYLASLGYAGYSLHRNGLRPIAQFDVQRDQLAFVRDNFMGYSTLDGYIYDFLFVRPTVDVSRLMATTQGGAGGASRTAARR